MNRLGCLFNDSNIKIKFSKILVCHITEGAKMERYDQNEMELLISIYRERENGIHMAKLRKLAKLEPVYSRKLYTKSITKLKTNGIIVCKDLKWMLPS